MELSCQLCTSVASNTILTRSTCGKNQNSNQNLRSVIWAERPKDFVSSKEIYLAVVEDAPQFNKGCCKTELARGPKEHTFVT